MFRAIMHGCNGAMGQVITNLIAEDPGIELVAGVDINTEQKNGYPVFASLAECDVEADVVIDFASAKATDALLAAMVEKKLPGVLCSTGLSEEQLEAVKEASTKVAILKSANMSLGINTLFKVLKMVTPILAEAGFDMEIVEKHHNRKLDAPSGTALALADVMNETMDPIVGEHEVIFAGTDEVITISHTAYSRAIFAKGAIAAAKYLAGKPAGYYDMKDVIG